MWAWHGQQKATKERASARVEKEVSGESGGCWLCDWGGGLALVSLTEKRDGQPGAWCLVCSLPLPYVLALLLVWHIFAGFTKEKNGRQPLRDRGYARWALPIPTMLPTFYNRCACLAHVLLCTSLKIIRSSFLYQEFRTPYAFYFTQIVLKAPRKHSFSDKKIIQGLFTGSPGVTCRWLLANVKDLQH